MTSRREEEQSTRYWVVSNPELSNTSKTISHFLFSNNLSRRFIEPWLLFKNQKSTTALCVNCKLPNFWFSYFILTWNNLLNTFIAKFRNKSNPIASSWTKVKVFCMEAFPFSARCVPASSDTFPSKYIKITYQYLSSSDVEFQISPKWKKGNIFAETGENSSLETEWNLTSSYTLTRS